MPVPAGVYSQAPSCLDKIKFGFGIGFCVGLSAGALFGSYYAFRAGFRGKELIRGTGKAMIQGGGSFGFFMAVGSGIRC